MDYPLFVEKKEGIHEYEKKNCHLSKTKILMMMVDGIGDVSVDNFDDLTPLIRANLPYLDLVSKNGLNGLLDPVLPGLACGSDTAHLSILGYDPFSYYRGRGSFESIGAGIEMKPGDIAFKCNFATWNPANNTVLSRRCDRHFEEEGPVLCDYLNSCKLTDFDGIRVTIKYATEHRCGIVISGPDLSDQIIGTDPLRDNLSLLSCEAIDPSDLTAIRTSQIVNNLSQNIHHFLELHPYNEERKMKGKHVANIILFRGCGSLLHVPQWTNKFPSLKSFMIAPTCIIAGLGKTLGIDVIEVEGATGDYRTNLLAKVSKAIELLNDSDYSFGFIHIKAVDDAGHDMNPTLKVRFLEKIDNMIGVLLAQLDVTTLLCVTGDHSTPAILGDHSTEPVPFMIGLITPVKVNRCQVKNNANADVSIYPYYNGFVDLKDHVVNFDELSAARGTLGRFCGQEMMPLLQKMKVFVDEHFSSPL